MIPFKYILITRTNFGYFFTLIDFHIVRWKIQKKLSASIKLRKKEIFWRWVGYFRILTCSSMGMNRHTDIKKNRILKTSMESYDNKRRKLLQIHFLINLRKNIICVMKQNLKNIVKYLWKSQKRFTYSLTNNISPDHICYSVYNVNM